MFQSDYLFGPQWGYYYHLAFARLWHDVPMYRTRKKYSPCSWGTEMLKRFVSSHYPLSNVSVWVGWLPRVLEDSGWTEGPWAEYLALRYARSPKLYTVCRCHLTSQIRLWSCHHRPSLSFYFFFKSLYKCYFKPKPRMAAVIMMPRNPGASLCLAQNSYRVTGWLGIPQGTSLSVLWWWLEVEGRRYSRSPLWESELWAFTTLQRKGLLLWAWCFC